MQPTHNHDFDARLGDILAQCEGLEGPLLPILNAVQNEFGYVPQDVIPNIAEHLNLSHAEVHGVISFYHDYRSEPAGKHVIKVCRAEACQAMGANALSDKLLSLLGLNWGESSADGRVTVEAIYCLGLCACAPAAMVNQKLIARLDDEKIKALAHKVSL